MTSFFLRNRVTTLVTFMLILLLGGISVKDLKIDLLPDISYPTLTVITVYENVSPSEIETLITRPIEEIVSSVNGVDRITSESLEGVSIVKIRFRWGTNMDTASIQTREKVDLVKGSLPIDAKKSVVLKFDPNDAPLLQIAVVPTGINPKELRYFLKKNIAPYFERVDGIAAVSITGGYEKQILVNIDRGKLNSYSLSPSEIIQRIGANNFNFPAGNIKREDREILVRTMGAYENVDSIADLVVNLSEAGAPVYLRSLAEVLDSYKERTSASFYDGEECVAVVLKKEAGKNSVFVSDEAKEVINFVNEEFGSKLKLIVVADQSVFIRDSIGGVASSGVQAIIICFFVLSFFLGTFRESIIVTLSIPVSVLVTLVFMYFQKMTLNTMSLGGLAVGVGMMVDSSIVVLESIFAFKKKYPDDPFKSSLEGTKDVVGSLFSSTLTSIVVFLPILFIEGIAASVFKEFALSITYSLISSFFVSVSFIPVLCTMPFFSKEQTSGGRLALFWAFREKTLSALEELYVFSVRFVISNRRKVTLSVLGLIPLTVLLFKLLPVELMPQVEKAEISAKIILPAGSSLDRTTEVSKRVIEILNQTGLVSRTFLKAGYEEKDLIINPKGDFGLNRSELFIGLTSYDVGEDLIENSQKSLDNLQNETGAQVLFIPAKDLLSDILPESGEGLTLEVSGQDLAILKEVCEEIRRELSELPNFTEATSSFSEETPELRVLIDRDKMAGFGLSVENVAKTLRAVIKGEQATRFRRNDDEIPVLVRHRVSDRTGTESLSDTLFKIQSGTFIRLRDFSDIVSGSSNRKILRYDGRRVGILKAQFSDIKYSEAASLAEPILKKYSDRKDISILPGETQKMMEKSINSLTFAIALSILLVYMVLASNMENVGLPFVILFSIFVSGVGVALGLIVTGKTLNIISVMGMILLAGVVVNNAIILIEFYQLHAGDYRNTEELVIAGGRRRLNPILSTTATTILGLLPLLITFGPPSPQGPMAASVMGGLIVSTVLTLVFIPMAYVTYVEQISKLTRKK
ncbi:efflux RND transporter permease subunit [Leptospira yasudae]|uniref:Acriflavin resistance protein n=1 Tax=Leptospira yasudae TaxID=2202201 RepID=A0ABX9M796_9LEPT|nr:efflux RND transporter permease subunit [Leptospira yasudae]RHX81906.1 acriflavin resistance protein [Leptospira yasudae]TGK30724.1 efflux RND transporter permease subunit [Leptospira yasudae]TGM03896.1 efflux RND transporter permease subunit [Leptospira yasudae]